MEGLKQLGKEKSRKESNLRFSLNEKLAQGANVNLSIVKQNEAEFVVDLIFLQPQRLRAKIRFRVILSSRHARCFVAVLQENISRYEHNFLRDYDDTTPC